MTNLVLSMWEQKRGNHSSIESSPIIILGLRDISQFNMCMWKISKVTNAIFCKRLEYTLELFNFEGKPARLGGAGKFCSIAGEEVDGEGRKRRAERVNTTNIGRRVVILSSLNNLHSRFELSQVIYYMYKMQEFTSASVQDLSVLKRAKSALCKKRQRLHQARSALWAPVAPIAYYILACHPKSPFWCIRNNILTVFNFRLLVIWKNMCEKLKMLDKGNINWSAAGNIPGSPEGLATHRALFHVCEKNLQKKVFLLLRMVCCFWENAVKKNYFGY